MTSTRTLRAVVFGDLADYSRLVGEDEDATLAFMESCFALVRQACLGRGGDLVRTTGDGFLVLFASVTDAVEFALDVHRQAAERDAGAEHPHRFRIGVHVGEVHRQADDVYGNTVNIAARLEALAEPGSTLVSQDVYRLARQGARCRFEAAGAPVLKNIRERILAYRVFPGTAPEVAVEPLRVSVLGGLSVSAPSMSPQLPRSDGVYGLLGSLALSSRHAESQGKLAALIWPDRAPRDARRALSRAARSLQRALEPVAPDALGRDEDRMWLSERSVTVDLDQILDGLARGQVDDALLHDIDWNQQVLPHLDTISPLLKAAARVGRKWWRRRLAGGLELCLERFEPGEEGARRAAMALLNLEPGHEPASRTLIQHNLARGKRAAALEEYDRLVGYLAREFGISPDPVITEIVTRLAAPRRAPAPPRPVAVERPRIAVAEFAAHGPGDHRLFGFRSELIANLARFREWSIVEADRADNAGKAANGDAAAGAGRYTLEGRHDAGDTLALRLVEDASRRVVWSHTLEISMTGWHELQRLVVGRIAAGLEIYMSADRLAHAIAREDASVSFDDWLRGEQLLSRWTPEDDRTAAGIFERIIERDPSFAPAYASRASIHNVSHVILPGKPRSAEESRGAHRLGQRAIELDPLDARNHLAVAWTAALTGAFDQAAIHLDMVVTLNTNSPKSLISAAMGYAFCGEPERAAELLDRAHSIAPVLLDYQWCYAAAVWFFVGDYEAAVDAAARSGDKIADNQGWRAAALVRLGRVEEAREAFRRLVAAVAPIWAGEGEATPERVRDWFTHAYPLRRPTDRARLSDALALACAEAGGA